MTSSNILQDGSEQSVKRTKKERLTKKVPSETVSTSNVANDSADTKMTIEAFTPSVLNNQIVAMRKIVSLAQLHTIRKLNRQIKSLDGRQEKKENERMKKKVDKIKEEIIAMKTIKKDEISKFALINKDSLGKLLNKPKTSPSERALFKLATSQSVEANVKAFRLSHPGSDASCAFMLQRLGLQYHALKSEKIGDGLKKKLKSGETIDVDAVLSEGNEMKQDSSNNSEKKKKTEKKSAIEKVLAKSIEKAKKEEKKSATEMKKKGKKIPEGPVDVKPIEIVKPSSKEAVVKKLLLQGGDTDDDEDSDGDEDVEMNSDDEGEDDSEGEESKEDSEEEDDEKEDGLSAFFLNTDGSSREVIASDMQDVEDDTEKDTNRGSMRGRGMRGAQGMVSRGRGRDRTTDTRSRGASDMRGGRPSRGMTGMRGRGDRGGRGTGGNRGAIQSSVSAPSSSVKEELHPSWIAKQKQKEMMKAGPSGKKITFD